MQVGDLVRVPSRNLNGLILRLDTVCDNDECWFEILITGSSQKKIIGSWDMEVISANR